nr:hypothetical protein [Endozoicomonas sp.]
MNSINGVTTSNDVTTLNPAEMSQQDFISAVYLERGEMLDSEVRRIIGEIDKSNAMVNTVNTLLGKANLAEYGASSYSATTWTANGGDIVLDNGYGLKVQPDGNGGTSFVLIDAEGNQLLYQSQTLIPVPAGTTVDALQVGIPVMSDMTMILDDGTEITFKTNAPDTAFNAADFSGGLADITSIIITRDNQGITISNLDSDAPVISAPTVETPTAPATDNAATQTETVTVPANYMEAFVAYNASDKESVVTSQVGPNWKETWLPVLQSKSPAEQAAFLQEIKDAGGINVDWDVWERSNGDDHYTQTQTYSPHYDENLSQFFERMIDRSAEDFREYIIDAESGGISIESVQVRVTPPVYSFEQIIPAGDKTTHSHGSISSTYSRDYHGDDDYGKLSHDFSADMAQQMKSDLHGLTPEQEAALKEKLQNEAVTIDWRVEESDGLSNDNYDKSYNFLMVSGESLHEYIDRITFQSGHRVRDNIQWDDGEEDINIDLVRADITFPAFDYDVYEGGAADESTNDPRPINEHSYDTSNNDGHILLESGGLHSWEYGGVNTSHLTQVNPNDGDDRVDGYFARKLAFNQGIANEYAATSPFLTQKEIDLLTQELKMSFSDASGTGHLTPEEWSALKENLVNVRDNLNGNSQLQTVQLQRAMLTYNQNFDAMSNAQQKIYSLLRDIISNIK